MTTVRIYELPSLGANKFAAVFGDVVEDAPVVSVGDADGTKSREQVIADLKQDIAEAGELIALIHGGPLSVDKFNEVQPVLIETYEI